MTHPSDTTSRRKRRTGRGWLRAAAVLLLLLIGLAGVELSRWASLPKSPLPALTTGVLAGSDAAAAAERAIDEWLPTVATSGVSICIGIEGQAIWCVARGWAELETADPLRPESSIRLGSVSKSVTSVILGRLLERGVLDLDRPIGALMPELPQQLRAVTPRQLASHTAGIRHYRWRLGWPPHESWSTTRYESVAASLAPFLKDDLLYPAGSDFAYSSHGYTLLGAVLERAAGEDFADLLKSEVAEPLGLSATTLDSDSLRNGWAHPYEVVGGRARGAFEIDNSRGWPGAGLRSSARDLAVLVSALPNDKLIARETLEILLRPQALAGGRPNPQNYALGWRLAETERFLGGNQKFRVAHHGGVSAGSSAFVGLFPDQVLAVAVLANSRTGSSALAEIAFEVAEPFMELRLAEPRAPRQGPLDPG